MQPIVTHQVTWSVGRSVTEVSPAKTTEPIEMPFGLTTVVGPGNHVLDQDPDPHGKGHFWGEGRPVVKYRDILWSSVQKTTEPIKMPFWVVGSDGPRESGVRHRC